MTNSRRSCAIRSTCASAGACSAPRLVEPIYLGTDFQVKLLNNNFKEEIFKNHVQFERKIARATGKGVVSITVVPPRASLRDSLLISLKCGDTVLQLTNLYDEPVSAGGTRSVCFVRESCCSRTRRSVEFDGTHGRPRWQHLSRKEHTTEECVHQGMTAPPRPTEVRCQTGIHL